MHRGLLLINLGTPEKPTLLSVMNYLRVFLSDKRVIDLPRPFRDILLYGIILPFRSAKTRHAYQAIWTPEGSPFLINNNKLLKKLQALLPDVSIALGMRYNQPSIQHALQSLSHCTHITVLPLYPQYASATTGSSIEKVLDLLRGSSVYPHLTIIRDFYQHKGFINALCEQIQTHNPHKDYLLFSYHGLPEKALAKTGCHPVCPKKCPPTYPPHCYRAQCEQTTQATAQVLGLKPDEFSLSFQSRLGKLPWIKPYTNDQLKTLRHQGIENLAVVCPSFVADCLETLEEIGIRAKQEWHDLGGKRFTLIPCLNDNVTWIQDLIN